jgi:cytochrome P450
MSILSPSATLDPDADAALLNAWPLYKTLRDMGPAVWLDRYKMFALTRYESVRTVLQDGESFPSSYGVMMNDDMSKVLRGNTLCSDGAAHDQQHKADERRSYTAVIGCDRSGFSSIHSGFHQNTDIYGEK